MRMFSIMRMRSGLMSRLKVVVARPLRSSEADCLINQQRKQSGFRMKKTASLTECKPRERFNPLAD